MTGSLSTVGPSGMFESVWRRLQGRRSVFAVPASRAARGESAGPTDVGDAAKRPPWKREIARRNMGLVSPVMETGSARAHRIVRVGSVVPTDAGERVSAACARWRKGTLVRSRVRARIRVRPSPVVPCRFLPDVGFQAPPLARFVRTAARSWTGRSVIRPPTSVFTTTPVRTRIPPGNVAHILQERVSVAPVAHPVSQLAMRTPTSVWLRTPARSPGGCAVGRIAQTTRGQWPVGSWAGCVRPGVTAPMAPARRTVPAMRLPVGTSAVLQEPHAIPIRPFQVKTPAVGRRLDSSVCPPVRAASWIAADM